MRGTIHRHRDSSSLVYSLVSQLADACRTRDCEDLDCGLSGKCEDGLCVCDGSFYGKRCHLSVDCPGVLMLNNQCCFSGWVSTVDKHGEKDVKCCPVGNTVDAAGACCDGVVDK
jgi:EGF-like domain